MELIKIKKTIFSFKGFLIKKLKGMNSIKLVKKNAVKNSIKKGFIFSLCSSKI